MGFLICAPIALAQTAIDFSFAGYGGGGVPAPNVAGTILVTASGGDDTGILQAALDHVASLPVRPGGFRGAVLLDGSFRVAGHLEMKADGVVLRGSRRTTIIATGTSRRTLIEIGNVADAQTAPPVNVADDVVAAGGRTFTLDSIGGLHPADKVVITRPSTAEWISALQMTGLKGTYANQRLDWAPGSRNLIWDRTIESRRRRHASRSRSTRPSPRPLSVATEAVPWRESLRTRRLTHVGIEDLTLESEFDPVRPRDEDHSWIAISLDRVEDACVRGVTVRNFAGSAVRVGQRARRVTVEDCRSEQPVSEPAGYRRQSFLVEGQQVLVRKCTAEYGMNDFASGLLAGGPNVFLDDTAKAALGPSGSFESWASGVLYERVRIEGAGLRLTNDSSRAEGAGWTAANSVVWNSRSHWYRSARPGGRREYREPFH